MSIDTSSPVTVHAEAIAQEMAAAAFQSAMESR